MGDKYNGWKNYATWRINLEIFDGYDTDGHEVTPEELKDIAYEAITGYGEIPEDSLAVSYADAFMSDVDWYEIAESVNEYNNQD